jgi:hypothetical protein
MAPLRNHKCWPVAFRLESPHQLDIFVGKHNENAGHDRERQSSRGGSCAGGCVPIELSGRHSRVVSDEARDDQGCRHGRGDGDEEERSASHAGIVALRGGWSTTLRG